VTAIRRSSVSEHVKPVIGFEDTVSGEGKKVEGAVIHETGKYPGTRGWALRWERVEVKILGKGEKADGVVVKRKGSDDERIATLVLDGVVVDDEDEEDEEDDYWDKFVDAIEEFA